MSSNGIISFRNPFDEFADRNMGIEFPTITFRHSVIAPLWIDLNPTVSGSINYTTSREPDVLNRTSLLLADGNPELCDFQPTLVVIVTWDKVPLHTNNSIIVCILYKFFSKTPSSALCNARSHPFNCN